MPDEPNEQSPSITGDADNAIAEQTPVYPVPKLSPLKDPEVRLMPTPDGMRFVPTPSQLRVMYHATMLLTCWVTHASDGADDIASESLEPLAKLLERYPVEFVTPKPKKKPEK